MTILGLLGLLSQIFYIGSGLAGLVFVVRYFALSDWRATTEGMVVLGVVAVLTVIIVLSTVIEFFWHPSQPVVVVLSFMFFGLLFAGMIHLNVILINAQRRPREGKGQMSLPATHRRIWETSDFWKDAGERVVTAFIEGFISVLLIDVATGPQLDIGAGWAATVGGIAAVLSTAKAIVGSVRSGSTTPVSLT